VLAIDRQARPLAETASLCGGPGRIVPLDGDVTDPALPDAIAAALAAAGRTWDALVNNAGIGGGGMAEATSDDDLQCYL
jgi:3-oxoacyl-[acyl-carrier protein] reductase